MFKFHLIDLIANSIFNVCLIYLGARIERHYANKKNKQKQDKKRTEPE
jgi:hypothetical protein